jgi:thiol-disulfide isomerase/thioredoxin
MPVIELNSQNENIAEQVPRIKKCIASSAVVLVWATWCPHCVSMKSEWNKFKKTVHPNINVVEIESNNLEKLKQEDKKLFKKLYPDENRVYYPLIKSFSHNKGVIYDDQRKSAIMKQHFETALKANSVKEETPKQSSKGKKSVKKSVGKQQKGGGNKMELFKKELDSYIKNLMKQI